MANGPQMGAMLLLGHGGICIRLVVAGICILSVWGWVNKLISLGPGPVVLKDFRVVADSALKCGTSGLRWACAVTVALKYRLTRSVLVEAADGSLSLPWMVERDHPIASNSNRRESGNRQASRAASATTSRPNGFGVNND